MPKFIAFSPNGTAYQCDTLAEARSVEGVRRNPTAAAKQRTAEGLLQRMLDDGCDTFAKKVAWVRKHLPHIDDPFAFVGFVMKDAGRERLKRQGLLKNPYTKSAQQSLFDLPLSGGRPAGFDSKDPPARRRGRGASECGAVLVGKRWHTPPPPMADVTECASVQAHTRWGTKRRNPADKHLAHERQEESYFAALLDSLPVGQTVTLGSGCRVRKLSKGYAVVNGQRLTVKQAAKMLHRGHL